MLVSTDEADQKRVLVSVEIVHSLVSVPVVAVFCIFLLKREWSTSNLEVLPAKKNQNKHK